MDAITDLSQPPDADTDDRTAIWVEIPDGYAALPLDDIPATMARAQVVIDAVVPDRQRPAVAPVIGALTYFLEDLALRNTLYCGVGHHQSAVDATTLTSTLVVSLQEFPQECDRSLVLKDLVGAKAGAVEKGQASVVELPHGPVLFLESTRKLPTPQIPGQPDVGVQATTPVYQLEALVLSSDGSKLVTIEFSTPFAEYGPEFRTMMVLMAGSVSFEPPAGSPDNITAKLEALNE